MGHMLVKIQRPRPILDAQLTKFSGPPWRSGANCAADPGPPVCFLQMIPSKNQTSQWKITPFKSFRSMIVPFKS